VIISLRTVSVTYNVKKWLICLSSPFIFQILLVFLVEVTYPSPEYKGGSWSLGWVFLEILKFLKEGQMFSLDLFFWNIF